jgi:hypothetical protein
LIRGRAGESIREVAGLIRLLLIAAVLANAVAFLWWSNLLPAQWLAGFGEPDRTTTQLAADKLALVPLDRLKPKQTVMTCVEMGPLEQLVGERLLVMADEMGDQVKVTSKDVDPQTGWVAFVPWNGDSRAMDRRFAELKRAGFLDAQAVLQGNLRGSISLGVYASVESAKQAAQQAANKSGLEVRVTELSKQAPRATYQLRYALTEDGAPNPVQSRITAIKIELGISSSPCPG